MSTEAWIAQSAAALCRGARWPIGLSLALAAVACVHLIGDGRHRAGMSLVLAAGVVQGYLALRIELDRRIFERFAADPDSAPEFDAALAQAGWSAAPAEPRAMADRAQGLKRLVSLSIGVLAAQAAVSIAAAWMNP